MHTCSSSASTHTKSRLRTHQQRLYARVLGSTAASESVCRQQQQRRRACPRCRERARSPWPTDLYSSQRRALARSLALLYVSDVEPAAAVQLPHTRASATTSEAGSVKERLACSLAHGTAQSQSVRLLLSTVRDNARQRARETGRTFCCLCVYNIENKCVIVLGEMTESGRQWPPPTTDILLAVEKRVPGEAAIIE